MHSRSPGEEAQATGEVKAGFTDEAAFELRLDDEGSFWLSKQQGQVHQGGGTFLEDERDRGWDLSLFPHSQGHASLVDYMGLHVSTFSLVLRSTV